MRTKIDSPARHACRLVLHDDSLAAPLRLIAAGLELHAEPFPPPPFGIEPAGSIRALRAGYSTSKGRGAGLTSRTSSIPTRSILQSDLLGF